MFKSNYELKAIIYKIIKKYIDICSNDVWLVQLLE